MTANIAEQRKAQVEMAAPPAPQGRPGLPRPGPGSLTWRCAADTRGLLLAPATLILQVAHPVVGAAVMNHSTFTAAPWSRLLRTLISVNRLVFGPDPVAWSESQRLRQLHTGIHGVDQTGRRYSALDPEVFAWVHLTLVHLFADVQGLFGPPLTAAELEQLYAEWRQIGRLLGVRDTEVPPNWAAFLRYFDDMVEGTLEANRAVAAVLATVAHPEKPFGLVPAIAWRPVAGRAGGVSLMFTVGTLPAALRERLGLSWTARDEASLNRQAAWMRAFFSVLPSPSLAFSPALPYRLRARLEAFASWPVSRGFPG
jgi:uncharacterized protein (DUF2236 family)